MNNRKGFFKNLFMKPFTSSNSSSRDQIEVDLEKVAAQERKNFPYKTLASATNNFSPSNKLGEGGFGPVFKGILDDGKVIAVKKLSVKSSQGKKEFQNEAKLLARVQHRNVVTLLGYCVADGEKLLVYEYVANESLDKLLFNSNRQEILDWKRRHDIIVGVAKGLLYLHDEAPYCILHRDIKASNVLLDDKWVPKIGDFGMARLYPEDETHVQTRVAGTNGYMAPEYLTHGNLSKKADVFSFGVVVLELVSGQKNSSFYRDPDSRNLLEWVYKLYKKQRTLEVMDPALISTVDPEQLAMCVQIGLLCVQSDPKLRPEMARVVVMLSKNRNIIEEPTGPGYSGSRYRRSSHRTSLLSSGTSGMNKSGSSGTTDTRSGSSGVTVSDPMNSRSDPKGKRPMK